MNGAVNPRGSYTELTIESNPRCVGCFSLMVTLNINPSFTTTQFTPTARCIVGWSNSNLSQNQLFLLQALTESLEMSLRSTLSDEIPHEPAMS